ncbi:MAG: hypothetical protein JWP63_677 [Candidatus Solibacter sp.]|nr:hypothetical protein [Candidatus Solibacter sp.]
MATNRIFRGALLSAALITALFCANTARGATITITVDENGNGSLVNSVAGTYILTSSSQTDTGPGGKTGVLAYNMLNPPGLVLGDVVITEGGIATDVLRFSSFGGGTLFFYSDLDGGIDSLADIGMPDAFNTNVVRLEEVAIPQGFGLLYTPTADQPGFVAGAAFPVDYVFVSGTVPEPASAFLVFPAAALVLWYRRSRPGLAPVRQS